jgi:hypothetical protein
MDARMLAPLIFSILILYGCSTPPDTNLMDAPEDFSPVLGESQAPKSTNTPLIEATPTGVNYPDELVLGIEARWLTASELALSSIELPIEVVLRTVDPSLDLLPVSDRAIALAVPWTSEWEQVSKHEAQALLEEDSPFVARVEWPEMTPAMKPLKIDGIHPSQLNYPLRTTWSLHAQPGLEEIAASIAQALSKHLVDEVVKVTAVGDIMLARGLGSRRCRPHTRQPRNGTG